MSRERICSLPRSLGLRTARMITNLGDRDGGPGSHRGSLQRSCGLSQNFRKARRSQRLFERICSFGSLRRASGALVPEDSLDTQRVVLGLITEKRTIVFTTVHGDLYSPPSLIVHAQLSQSEMRGMPIQVWLAQPILNSH